MNRKKLFSNLYPLAVTLPWYLLLLLLLHLDRFDWTGLKILAAAGMTAGILAEIMQLRAQNDLTVYLKKTGISIVLAAGFWLLCTGTQQMYDRDHFGFWLKDSVILFRRILLFLPAAATSVYWLIAAKKPTEKITLILTNPVTHLAVWWTILNTLLSCLPT